MNIDINTVKELNGLVVDGGIETYISQQEAKKKQLIATLADEIAEKNHNLKWIWLAGPSSAGKTTFTNQLAAALHERAIPTHEISLDNYFRNRELTPKNEKGEYDYEHIDAVDLPLLERDLNKLSDGHTIEMPHFKFLHGKREFRGEMLKLEPNELALIEGIHALNPRITSFVDIEHSLKIYVCARTTLKLDNDTRISTTDNRLLRRMIRDNTFRGNSAEKTFNMWPLVRAGEDKWIFPFQPLADREYNSALGYELSVLKPFAEPLLKSLPKSHPGYEKAQTLIQFLNHFVAIDESLVPEKSILHEFIDTRK